MCNFALLLLAVASLSAPVLAQPQSLAVPKGQLTIRVVDPNGLAAPAGTLSVRAESGEILYRRSGTNAADVELPFGRYDIRFESDFALPVSRTVTLDQQKIFTVIAAAFNLENTHVKNNDAAVSLRVNPAESCSGSAIWARLAGVFNTYLGERQITATGYSLFDHLPVGTYLLAIIDGPSVRAVEVLRTSGPVTTLVISLPPCDRRGAK